MARETLGIIGLGAFGAFMAPYLAPHFDLVLHDAGRDPSPLARAFGATAGSLDRAAACPTIILAVPVQKMERVLRDIAPMIGPGTLVIDVGSVKVKPVALMESLLPAHATIVGTHPLFGPQSGRDGIAGLNIAVCEVRGGRAPAVARFCRDALKLRAFEVTAEEHDRQLAYVHGLTHLLAKVIVSLNLPDFQLTTKTYDLLSQAIEMVRYDSDELFRAIERENPFAAEAKKSFFAAARQLDDKLSRDE